MTIQLKQSIDSLYLPITGANPATASSTAIIVAQATQPQTPQPETALQDFFEFASLLSGGLIFFGTIFYYLLTRKEWLKSKLDKQLNIQIGELEFAIDKTLESKTTDDKNYDWNSARTKYNKLHTDATSLSKSSELSESSERDTVLQSSRLLLQAIQFCIEVVNHTGNKAGYFKRLFEVEELEAKEIYFDLKNIKVADTEERMLAVAEILRCTLVAIFYNLKN